MKKILRIEFERAFNNKRFYTALIIGAGIVIYDFITNGLYTLNSTIPFLLDNVSSGKVDSIPGVFSAWIGLNYGQTRTVTFAIIPLLAAFGYGSTLYEDEKRHYNYNIITRTKKSNYYISKLIVMFVSGGITAVFPFFLSFILSALILPFEEVLPCLSYFMNDIDIFSDLFYSNPIVYSIVYMLWVFVLSGLLNCICFMASYIFANGYIVMIAPFCVYFLSHVISGFASNFVSVWGYIRMNDVRESQVSDIITQVLILVLLTLVCLLLISRKKRDVL